MSGAGERTVRQPTLLDALVPLGALALLIAGSLTLFGLDALDGPIQVALVLACAVAALVALRNGHPFTAVQAASRGALASVTSAVFILLAVGALIGVWNLSGTIPTLVYYGLQVLSPGWFFAAAALICGAVAMSIGSSWTTVATIGVGLVGIATLLDVSAAVTAGAVISGAYLGDKLSPLSETTILTAQIAEVEVHEHIRRQAWTSVPAFVLAFAVLLVIGLTRPTATGDAGASDLAELGTIYRITPLALLPVVVLGVLSARKVPASLALLGSTLFAGVLGAVLQPHVYREFVAGTGNPLVESVRAVWRAMANGFAMDSGVADVDRLLSRGGMDSMLLTIWLIIGAVTFGAVLEEFGLIDRLVVPLIERSRSTGQLFLTVFGCGFGLNVVAGDQYIALVLPGRIFRAEFARRGLAPTNLSRLAADSATVTSPLVPWNSCGAFMGATLGVPTLLYAPYAVFCWASPALSVLYGFTGFRIERTETTSPTLEDA